LFACLLKINDSIYYGVGIVITPFSQKLKGMPKNPAILILNLHPRGVGRHGAMPKLELLEDSSILVIQPGNGV